VLRKKRAGSHVALRGNISTPVRVTNLIKASKDAASLEALEKNFFALGCEWRHKWRNFWPPWPTSPGPGHQPLDGSISEVFIGF